MHQEIEDNQIHGEPHTTEAAAYAKLLRDVKAVRGQVLRLLARYSLDDDWGGLTDRELDDLCEREYGVRGRETYRKRRPELWQAGLVEPTLHSRVPRTSKNVAEQQVWRVVPLKQIQDIASNSMELSEYVMASVKIPRKPKPKASKEGASKGKSSEELEAMKARVVRSEMALMRIKAALQEHRANFYEDRIWRMACEGLGIDPAEEADDAA